MRLKPIKNRIIVIRDVEEDVTKGGIIIPDTQKEKIDQGTVTAVGDGLRDGDGNLIPMTVKVGDKVLFGKYTGETFKLDGEDYVAMNEQDVISIMG